MLQPSRAPAAQRSTLRIPVFCALLAFTSAAAWGQDTGLALQAALAQATSRSAAVQAGQAAERAGAHATISAGQLPDPMLDVGIDNLPLDGPERFSLTRDFMTARHIGIEQEWVSADKRERRTTLASRKVDQERADTLVQLANVRRQTALAWLDAAYTQQALDLAQALVQHMTDELGATQASYSGLRASATDVTQAQQMRAQAVDGMLRVQQAMRSALIALGRWVVAPVTRVAGDVPALESPVAALAPQQLQRVQPELIAAAHAVAASDAAIAVASSNRSPNWTWSVTYQQRGSQYSNMVSVGVKIPLPIARGTRQDQDVAETAARAEQARLALSETERQVAADIQTLATALASGKARVAQLNDTLLPAARQQVELAIAAYKSGAGPLTSIFDARRSLLEAQLQVVDLERETARTWAQLEYQVVPQSIALGQ